MKMLLKEILELFYPRICNGCGKPLFKDENVICLDCNIKLPRTEFGFEKDNPIEQLFWGRLPVNRASSFLYFRKSGLAQRLIHQLKYKNKSEVGYHLGYIFGQEIRQTFLETNPDLITTVPLHSEKLKIRGFNQSDEIAKGFSESTGIPFSPDVLIRNDMTETQTRKRRYERWENMENKFGINENVGIEGKHIVLIDDVITTGSTLEACGKSLIEQKDVSLSLLSLCIAIN